MRWKQGGHACTLHFSRVPVRANGISQSFVALTRGDTPEGTPISKQGPARGKSYFVSAQYLIRSL